MTRKEAHLKVAELNDELNEAIAKNHTKKAHKIAVQINKIVDSLANTGDFSLLVKGL